MRQLLGNTGLGVFPICLGGNVFGWTADEAASLAVLDTYSWHGGNFIDTADSYTWWGEGNAGGESETIIGKWMSTRGNREHVVIATKVGIETPRLRPSLKAAEIHKRTEASLRRLATDYVDLLYAHKDDPGTPLEETLDAFDKLVREGKVRYIAASNYSATRLSEALAVSKECGLSRFSVLSTHYNLVVREQYEGSLAELCRRERLPCVPYWGLAKGFLTGKYRPGARVESARAKPASAYLDERGAAVLAALDEVAGAHGTTVPAVALAWLLAQPTVAAAVASARTPAQLAELLPAADLRLSQHEIDRLSAVSESRPAGSLSADAGRS